MVSPDERRLENAEYKKNFYVDGQKLFCTFCQHVVDYTKKSTLDSHLKSDKHKSNIIKTEKLKLTRQTTLDIASISSNERELINIALVNAFTKADISLYKVDKLKDFFLENCRN
ncbi:18448_t:CDS:1, partial [Racocetra persica]